MRRDAWLTRAALAALLAVLGAASAAGSVAMARRYVQMAATVSRFEARAEPVALPDGRAGVRVRYRNPGPWPVELVEAQVLAWHDGRYVGAASLDLRARPLQLPPGGEEAVELAWPGAPEATAVMGAPGAGGWRFSLSGRLILPAVGVRTFQRAAAFPEGGAP